MNKEKQIVSSLSREEQILEALGLSSPAPMEEILNKINFITKGNTVALKIWEWLREERQMIYVPWVIDPKSKTYDPIKAAEQRTKNKFLNKIENIMSS